MIRYSLFVFFASIFMCSCKSKSLQVSEVNWLVGDWRMEDGRGIESWQLQGDTLIGRVFSNREKKYSEALRIYCEAKGLVYEATVFDQNGGRPILFNLEQGNNDSLHFVNMNHDFPNYIDYKRTNDSIISCHVYDKKGQSFKYKMIRIKSE